MEKNHATQAQANPSKGKIKTRMHKISRYRSAVPVAFASAFILFFFSFCNFKCNDTKVASLKGIDLVTGYHLKVQGDNLFNSGLMKNPEESKQAQKIPANFWAIFAFLSAIAGFVVFYKNRRKESWLGMLLGATGSLSLLILQIIIKNKTDDYAAEMVNISVGFSFAYWLCLFSFLFAGGVSFLQLTEENENPFRNNEDFPPEKKKVPIQVNIITQQNNDTENNIT